MHLSGAYALLEASGGIEHWINSPRTVAQIGLLIWYVSRQTSYFSKGLSTRRWDTITSLLSRQACVFPYSYLEAALRHKTDQTWNFFGLCGCPQNLALSAVQLAHLVVANQRTPTSQFSSFDADLVSEIEQSLQTWQHTSPVDAWVNEESMHRDNDEMHCSEAWRYGLLIYIYRVFQWQSGMPVPVQIAHQARLIVDHVFACRDTGYLAKQAIFPLFLAGCEITDQSVRRRISGFCIFWSDKTRYRMMNDVMPLLEDVWLAQETYGLHNVCWTSIIDKWHAFYRTEGTIPKTLTFG